MIVKIENKTNNGFNYYEGSEVQFCLIELYTAIENYKNFDTDDLFLQEEIKDKDLLASVIHVYKKNCNEFTMIISTGTIYIINNEGKTIDKIK